ncbi:MAG: hypothetical protein JWN40_1140 [Phycisphaerales bacterium]|nr:hypothetical protein [Phycisphaerales bacterium]
MVRFYVQANEEYRCRKAVLSKRSITVTGQTEDGRLCTASGRIQSVEAGQRNILGYPLRITMQELQPGELP